MSLDDLAGHFAERRGVQLPDPVGRHFGSDTLRVDGKIFAMSMDGRLILKLPAERVAELISEGPGQSFGTKIDRPMREWVSLPFDADAEARADEAYAFVSRAKPSAKSTRRLS